MLNIIEWILNGLSFLNKKWILPSLLPLPTCSCLLLSQQQLTPDSMLCHWFTSCSSPIFQNARFFFSIIFDTLRNPYHVNKLYTLVWWSQSQRSFWSRTLPYQDRCLFRSEIMSMIAFSYSKSEGLVFFKSWSQKWHKFWESLLDTCQLKHNTAICQRSRPNGCDVVIGCVVLKLSWLKRWEAV